MASCGVPISSGLGKTGDERMRVKRSLKKGINVITAVGCIIYAAFQGGMEKKSNLCDLQILSSRKQLLTHNNTK